MQYRIVMHDESLHCSTGVGATLTNLVQRGGGGGGVLMEVERVGIKSVVAAMVNGRWNVNESTR